MHYGVLAEQVVAEIERDPVDLIETLAERIAAAVLTHRAALATEVTVHKPQAPDHRAVHRRLDHHPAHPRARTRAGRGSSVSRARRRPRRQPRRPGEHAPRRGRRRSPRCPASEPVASSHEVESVAVTLDGLDTAKPRYRNAVVVVDTDLEPQALLDALHGIEDAHGRTREVRWGDRTLDLDVVARTTTLRIAHRHADRAAPPGSASGPSCSRRGSTPTPTAVLPGAGPVADLLAARGGRHRARRRAAPVRRSRPGPPGRPPTATTDGTDASA